jgi:5-methylcytosine-specific restriction endonuclease McrA
MAFPQSVKDDAYSRSGGQCECTRTSHPKHSPGRCPTQLTKTSGEYHHRTAVASGGDDTLSNCEYLCIPCHDLIPTP